MKSKYLNKIFEANELAMKCPKMNSWGASATVSLYVTLYKDFSEVLVCLRNIIYEANQIDSWEKCISKFKGDPDFDEASVLSSIQECEKRLDDNFIQLRDFVEERTKRGWS